MKLGFLKFGLVRRIRQKNGVRVHSKAIMLVDCLVFIAIWLSLTGVMFSAFYRSLSFSTRLVRSTEDISIALQTGERWREDIRKATATIRVEETGNRSEQALHIPHSQGEVSYLFTDHKLFRRESQQAPWVRLMSDIRDSNMVVDPRQHITAWRWEMELFIRDPKARMKPLFSFNAVSKIAPAK